MSRFIKVKQLFSVCIILIIGCSTNKNCSTKDLQKEYPNILNIKGTPQHYTDRDKYCFSDLGSWHGFGLPDSSNYYGGFTGPFMIPYSVWQSKSLAQLSFEGNNGNIIDFANCTNAQIYYFPGLLNQTFNVDSITFSMNLFFISNRTAAIRVNITNSSDKNISFYKKWSGEVLYHNSNIVADKNNINLLFKDNQFFTSINFNDSINALVSADSSSYSAKSNNLFTIKKGLSYSFSFTQSFYFDKEEQQADSSTIEEYFTKPDRYLSSNKKRWNGYLNSINVNKDNYPELAVKSLITLTNNWRSAAGELHHEGLFPSYAYTGFHGFWSWDSWKHSVALVDFAPELAKNQIRTMFDYQDKHGMVADCIFRDTTYEAVNWRDTKPPLASWAVLEVFNKTHDTIFVVEMLPKLQKYHKWWYANRDNDKNGLCEYGSTDGTRVAAAWESGMDNAVRFDNAKMIKNNDSAWSLDQESVDLNCYLFAEKEQLAQLNTIIGNTENANVYNKQAEQIKTTIQNTFYNNQTGFFYDIDIKTKKHIIVEGPEGWIPLWTAVATHEQAKKVVDIIMDTTKFNTFVPLPTLTKDHHKFNPQNGYWRGPVWLDQAYFAVKGLQKYGYNKEADYLTKKLIENAQGLANSDSPIRENYHPVSGEGLNANHFSWSAAHYLLLLKK